MEQTKMPSKEEVRTWLRHELDEHRPPPSPERIREMLGWNLIEAERACRPA